MTQKKAKISRILFLMSKTILVLWMISGGISALLGAEFMVEQIAKLGYPEYFSKVLGMAKLIGAFFFIFPVRKILKVLTYCGVIFEVSMASISYLLAGFWEESLPPIVFLIITAGSFFLWFKSRQLTIGQKPKLPKTNDFRPELITNKGFVKIYKTFQIKHRNFSRLKKSVLEKRVSLDQEVFNVFIGEESLSITLWNLAYHHLAEGILDKTPFLITFCPVCNSGMLFNRTVDDEVLEFYVSGVYRGTMIMCDKPTNSYWDHITGICLGGYYTGKQLDIIDSHHISTVRETLSASPETNIAIPKLSPLERFFTKYQNGHVWRKVPEGKFYPGFKDSFEFEDSRRPEKELGLGIFHGGKAKFYPLEIIKNEKLIEDEFQNELVIVKMDDTLGIPKAEFPSKPKDAPMQLFLRWYGFAQTFKDCDIYEAKKTNHYDYT